MTTANQIIKDWWVLHDPTSTPDRFKDPKDNATEDVAEAMLYPDEQDAKGDAGPLYKPRRLKDFWPPKS